MNKVALLLALSLLPGAYGLDYGLNADFYVVDVAPQNVYPGEDVTMNITLKNLGESDASYLNVAFDPYDTSPISAVGVVKIALGKVEGGLMSQQYFGVIHQGDILEPGYSVHVDENASTGTYYVPLYLTWVNRARASVNQTLYTGINVVGTPNLVISSISTAPSKIYADSDFNISIKIENIGTYKARAVAAKLSFPPEFSGENTSFLGTISRDASSTTTYSMRISKTADVKNYPFRLTLNYIDENEEKKSVDADFEVYVGARGEINIEIGGVSTSPARIYPGTDFTLSVQLENIGKQDAKSVKAEIEPIPELTGEYSSFVGKIEIDDVSSGIFDLTVAKNAKPGLYNLKMLVTHTDEAGKEYTKIKNLPIYIDSPTRSYGVISLIVFVLLAGGGVYLWRKVH